MEGANAFLEMVGDGIGTVIGWTGEVLNALFGTSGALAMLAPLFAVFVSISAILLGGLVI